MRWRAWFEPGWTIMAESFAGSGWAASTTSKQSERIFRSFSRSVYDKPLVYLDNGGIGAKAASRH